MPASSTSTDQQQSPVSRIGLIGDVHSEDERLETAINTLLSAGAQTLLCTGDLCDGPGDLEKCISLIKQHNIRVVRGNHDRWALDDRVRHIEHAHLREDFSPETIAFLTTLPTQISVTTTAGQLLLCHGVLDNDLGKVWPGSQRMPPERSQGLDKLIEQGHYRLLINGHMHYRIVLDFPGLTHINAGTLSPRHRPGVTLMDCDNNRLHVFEYPEDDKSALRATTSVNLFDDSRHQWPNSAAFPEVEPDKPDAPAPLALYE